MKAFTWKQEGESSRMIEIRTDVQGPTAPYIVNLTCSSLDSIYLQWERPASYYNKIDYYFVYYRPENSWEFEEIALSASRDQIDHEVLISSFFSLIFSSITSFFLWFLPSPPSFSFFIPSLFIFILLFFAFLFSSSFLTPFESSFVSFLLASFGEVFFCSDSSSFFLPLFCHPFPPFSKYILWVLHSTQFLLLFFTFLDSLIPLHPFHRHHYNKIARIPFLRSPSSSTFLPPHLSFSISSFFRSFSSSLFLPFFPLSLSFFLPFFQFRIEYFPLFLSNKNPSVYWSRFRVIHFLSWHSSDGIPFLSLFLLLLWYLEDSSFCLLSNVFLSLFFHSLVFQSLFNVQQWKQWWFLTIFSIPFTFISSLFLSFSSHFLSYSSQNLEM